MAGVLSPKEQQQWRELADRLAADPNLAALTGQSCPDRSARQRPVSLACCGTGRMPAPRPWWWLLTAALLILGFGLAVLGARLTEPAIGLPGMGMMVLTICIPLPLLLEDRQHRRDRP